MSTGHLCRKGWAQGTKQKCRTCSQKRQRKNVYNDPRWNVTRRRVFERDDWTCVLCGWRDDMTERYRYLVCDHYPIPVLEAVDPFGVEGCRTLCDGCSGHEDGGGRLFEKP